MPVVDTHAHFWPEPLLDHIRAGRYAPLRLEESEGVEWLVHSAGLRYPLLPTFIDRGAKLEQMSRDGIDIALDSIPAPYFFYDLEPEETLSVSRVFNDAIAEHANESGGRIKGLATVPLNDPGLAAEELRRARKDLGLVGVEIGTSLDTQMLDDPKFDPVFAAAQELRLPVMLHPYLSMLHEQLPMGLDRSLLGVIFANPVETTAAAGRLVLGGVFDRFPELVVQLVHGGGYFPYQLGRLQRAYEINPALSEGAARAPIEYLDNLIFDTVIFEPQAVHFLVKVVGANRVVLGTDQPFLLSDTTLLTMETLSPEDAELALGANATRVFGL